MSSAAILSTNDISSWTQVPKQHRGIDSKKGAAASTVLNKENSRLNNAASVSSPREQKSKQSTPRSALKPLSTNTSRKSLEGKKDVKKTTKKTITPKSKEVVASIAAPTTEAVTQHHARKIYSKEFLYKFKSSAVAFTAGEVTPSDLIEVYDKEFERKQLEKQQDQKSSSLPSESSLTAPQLEKPETLAVPTATPTITPAAKSERSKSAPKRERKQKKNKENIPTKEVNAAPAPSATSTPVVAPAPLQQRDENIQVSASAEPDVDALTRKLAAALKELDPRRLAQRQKQIDFGKNTKGYDEYVKLVPKNRRKREDAKTPNKLQVCSKRSWDGQIRKWRRQLHEYDPEEAKRSPLNEEDMLGLDQEDEDIAAAN